jgi:hypothetical protein
MKTKQPSTSRLLIQLLCVHGTIDPEERQSYRKPKTIELWQLLQNIHKLPEIYRQIKR